MEGRIENVEEGEEDVAGVIDRDNFANDGAIGGNVNDAEADDGKQHNVEVKEDEQEWKQQNEYEKRRLLDNWTLGV